MADFSDARLRDILRGRRSIRVYPWPDAADVKVGIRIVTDAQFDEARASATEHCKKMRVDMSIDPEAFDREVTRQVILRAFVDPETIDEMQPSPFFPGIDEIRSLDTRLIESLAALYQEHGDWMAPLRSLDQAQAQGFIEALKKVPGSEVAFSAYEHSTLVRLLISLVRATQAA